MRTAALWPPHAQLTLVPLAPCQEVRRGWAERAYQGDSVIDFETESREINQDKLYSAKQAYDSKQKVHACIEIHALQALRPC